MPRATTGEDRRDPLIALRIPPALDQRLRSAAASTGSSISEIVRHAIEQRLSTLATPAGQRATPIQVQSGVRFKPVTEVTDERTGAKYRVRKATVRELKSGICVHRVRVGNFCKRCDRIVV